MTTFEIEVQVLAVVVAVTCALPGVFLVLRRMALLSDAIAHSILLGIVLVFLVVQDLSSPFLILGAAAMGVVTVALVEALERTRRVREDAAIALVFPALFSIAVLLIAREASHVHLDVDSVLLGELALTPFDRWVLNGRDLGPRSLWVMGGILVANGLLATLFFKELKLSTFDAGLAATLGFAPVALQYAFMTMVSVTAVGAFEAVGSILVVALMIAPPATARLLTHRLSVLLPLSLVLAALAAVVGVQVAFRLDTSLAGSMAVAAGIVFAVVLVIAPERGVVAGVLRRRRQEVEFAGLMLVVHLLNHEGDADVDEVSRLDHLLEHLRWPADVAQRVVRHAIREGFIEQGTDLRLRLTPLGREVARHRMLA
jgi:manganese/zinc/iron transport system permease protein